jgi:hypothetical protein
MEKNKLKIAWIWIWYNDITRLSFMAGIPLIPIVYLAFIFGFPPEHLKKLAMGIYALFMIWMFADNDYSNLRRIGMNEYREKLKDISVPSKDAQT